MTPPARLSPRRRPYSWPRAVFVGACLAGLVFITACSTQPEPPAPADGTKYTLENTDRFVVLNRTGKSAVTCTGFTEHALADGRMEVVASLKNRDNRPVEVQADCVFKDESGQNELEETAWQNVSIPASTTEAVHFTASSVAAKSYTVRVRDAHE